MTLMSLISLFFIQIDYVVASDKSVPRCLTGSFIIELEKTQRCIESENIFDCGWKTAQGVAVGTVVGMEAARIYTARQLERGSGLRLEPRQSLLESYWETSPEIKKINEEMKNISDLKNNKNYKSKKIVSDGRSWTIDERMEHLEQQKRGNYSREYRQFSNQILSDLKSRGYNTQQLQSMQNLAYEFHSALLEHDKTKNSLEKERQTAIRAIQSEESKKATERLIRRNGLSPEQELDARIKRIEQSIDEKLRNEDKRFQKHIKGIQSKMAELERSHKLVRPVRASFKGGVAGFVFSTAIMVFGEKWIDDGQQIFNQTRCQNKIPYASEQDRYVVEKNGLIDDDCQVKISDDRIWDLIHLSPGEREKILKASPTLCKVLEKTLDIKNEAFANKTIKIQEDKITCDHAEMTVPITVGQHEYVQKYVFGKDREKIIMSGSFFSSNDLPIDSSESFQMSLNKDLKWSNITSITTYGASLIRDSFLDDNFLNIQDQTKYVLFVNKNCDPIRSDSEGDKKIANKPESASRLKCAVGEQVLAAKTVVPLLLNYYEKKCAPTSRSSGSQEKHSRAQ